MTAPMPSQETVKRVLSYDPETGIFVRRQGYVNRPTGFLDRSTGYYRIDIEGINYYAHRLAWVYMTGEWPKNKLDHKNTIKTDNRWENLREASNVDNGANCKARVRNQLGLKGVSKLWRRDKYEARLQVAGKRVHLGHFATPEEAHEAYKVAAIKYFGEFANAG